MERETAEAFGGTERFEVRRQLGAGGMGVVYEALDRQRGTVVALKTLRHLDPRSIQRFKQEFRVLADLHHPGLVRLDELFYEGGRWFFTMELVRGVDFLAYVRPGGELDEQRLRDALAGLAEALCALHEAGKVHRDVKPSNVLITGDGRVVICDFGLVGGLPGSGSGSGSGTGAGGELDAVIGTAAYMAPEQSADGQVGAAADWYSVGTMLFEGLTGSLPFDGAPFQVVIDKTMRDAPRPSERDPRVPPDLDALCADLTRLDPRARTIGRDVLARLGGTEPSVRPRSHPTPSVAPPAPFVGRRDELGALREALGAVRRGRPIAVFVRGESGLGKSALVRAFEDELEESGIRAVVLSGRCYERESQPFNALDGVIEALARRLRGEDPSRLLEWMPADAALLARLFPALRLVPAIARQSDPDAGPSASEVRTRAVAALREILAHYAEERPVLVFVDDLQWADADSRALLAQLLDPPEPPALLFVATMYGAEHEIDLGSAAEVRRLDLGRLPVEDAERVAAAALLSLAARDDRRLAAALAREADGHPFYIQELARHGGGLAAARLDDALHERVADLGQASRAALAVLAVAGAPLPQGVVAEAAGLAGLDLPAWLGPLRAAHLARVVRARSGVGSSAADAIDTYHDRVRAAVLANLGAETIRETHVAIADALESAGQAAADPRRLIAHLRAAGERARAGRHAERAAGLAAGTLAFDQATELYRLALELEAAPGLHTTRLRLALAEALANAGRGAEAAEAYLAAAEGADAATRLECRRTAAEQLLLSGRVEEGLRALAAVLAEIGEKLPPTPRRALLSVAWNRMRLRMRGLGWTPRDESEIARRDLVRLDVYRSVSMGLGLVDTVRAADFQARGLLLALDLGEPNRVGRALLIEAMFQASQGLEHAPRARQLLGLAEQIRASTANPYLDVMVPGASGVVAFCLGDLRGACELLRHAENLYETRMYAGQRFELHNGRLFRMISLRHLGEVAQLRAEHDRWMRDAVRRGDRYTETALVRALAHVWLFDDAPEEARRQLDRPLWAAPSVGGFHVQHWYELHARIEIDLYQGMGVGALGRHVEAIARLERSLLLRVASTRVMLAWLRGRVALLEGDPGRAAVAAAALEREGIPTAAVWARMLRAGVASARGDTPGALAALGRAAEAADALGSSLYREVIRRGEGLLRGGPDGAALVREAESRLAASTIRAPDRIAEALLPL